MKTDLPQLTRVVYSYIFASASILISLVHLAVYVGLLVPSDQLIIANDAALMATFVGLTVLCHLQGRARAQSALAAVLGALALLSLWRVSNPEHALSQWLWMVLGFRQQWPEILAYLAIALVFVWPLKDMLLRLMLWGSGLILSIGGAALMGAIWLTDLSHQYDTALSAALLAAGWIMMAGLALWLLGMASNSDKEPQISQRALSFGLVFMLLSISSWYLLSLQFQRSLQAESLASIEMTRSVIQGSVQNRIQLMQRTSSRWSSQEGLPVNPLRQRELQEYFGHFPDLRNLSLTDSRGQVLWEQSADRYDDTWTAFLSGAEFRDWLSNAPDWANLRLVHADAEGLAPPAIAITVPVLLDRRYPSQLTGIFKLDQMFRHGMQFDPSPYSVQLQQDGQVLQTFLGSSPGPDRRLMAIQHLPLNPEVELQLATYHTDSQALLREPFFYLLVALMGNLFAIVIAVAIELAQRSAARSRELDRLLRKADSVSHLQGMIAQASPLFLTLRGLCEVVESEIPDCRAAIMVSDTGSEPFRLAADVRLSAELRQLLVQLPDAATGAPAAAAAAGKPAIASDIKRDPAWAPHRHAAMQADVRAVWSYPAMNGSGDVLGTLVIIRGSVGGPDQKSQSLAEEIVGLLILAMEVDTDRTALRKSEQRYSSLFSEHPDAVFSLDKDGRFASVNKAVESLLGSQQKNFIGLSADSLLIHTDRKLAALQFRRALRGEACRYVVRCRHASGHVAHLDLTSLPIMINGQVQGIFGIAKDITAQRLQEAQLAFSASHDALTGLPNRSLLTDRLTTSCQQAIRNREFLAVLFIDLDGFKPINDSLGHAVGDTMLVEVGQRLQSMLRPKDTLARFGGDEFVVILTDLSDATAATSVIEAILESLGRPYQIDGSEITLTASIGISYSDGDIDNPMQLVQQADMAMYQAKQRGRNHFQWYTLDINTSVNRRVALRNELQEAIDQEQFELHYQPIYQAGTDRIRTLEALIRWKDPKQGYRSPAEFIPLAEDTGQIIPISHWVMQQACRDLKQLRQHSDVSVSVNLSFVQFRRPNFLDSVLSVLDEAGLPREAMTLELTESILMEDTEGAIEVLTALRQTGIRVAIDDFGTGFSSLSYLRRLPVNELKIDRSFVRELTENPHDAAITSSIINMAHQLKLEVIAEGVETEAQANWLIENDCDGLQGFYFAHPTPLLDLQQLLGAAEIK
ncbi:MAG: EAL domain-containing protein [Natronospirillum sp.]|uniref:putative bifunctional diguanylate cyclase/phosphodiesterase n=1 Tax=Natronospirillum sp. TaxID=2812955 RepID=UPI0025DCA2CA|nr:EAL domain-containing protein [Natronospirillum sp.]MCH8550339.1 EAL domain-containing protein [Natronospirillum sp.]